MSEHVEPDENIETGDKTPTAESAAPSAGADVDREALDEMLDSTAPLPFAKHIDHTKASCLARETMKTMLTSGPDLAGSLRAVIEARATDAFGQFAPHRQMMRRWAGRAAADPFISRCLQAAAEHKADFLRAVEEATAQLNSLRLKFEIENRGARKLAVERGSDGKVEVIATSSWAAIAKAFPADAKEVHVNIAIAELAAGRIRHAATDINRELALFFGELVPKAFGLLARLPRRELRERVGRIKLTAALAATLVDAAQTTDFVADPASKLGFKRLSLPKRFRLLATLPEHAKVRELIVARRIQTARTVVVEPPAGPSTESE